MSNVIYAKRLAFMLLSMQSSSESQQGIRDEINICTSFFFFFDQTTKEENKRN
jgi:hypothetical protein